MDWPTVYTVLSVITGALNQNQQFQHLFIYLAVFVFWSCVYVCTHRHAEQFSLFLIIQSVVSVLMIFQRIFCFLFFIFTSNLFVVLSAGRSGKWVCCQLMSHSQTNIWWFGDNHCASLSNDPTGIISHQGMGQSCCNRLLSSSEMRQARSQTFWKYWRQCCD